METELQEVQPVEAPQSIPAQVDKQAEKEARKKALREELRNGRNSTASRASEDTGGNEPGTDRQNGSGFEDAGRAVTELASRRRRSQSSTGRDGNDSGSAERRPVRRGRTNGRSRGGDSGARDDSPGGEQQHRGIGRLVTEEADTVRLNPDSPAGEFYREEPAAKSPKKAPVKKGKTIRQQIAESGPVRALRSTKKPSLVMSDEEAEEAQETLLAALEDDFAALDKYLYGRQRLYTPDAADDDEVWSNMTEREIGTLVRVMIKGAKHNPAMATVVRGVIDSRDYIGLVSILGPRLKTTARIMRDTHRPPQKRAEQRRVQQ